MAQTTLGCEKVSGVSGITEMEFIHAGRVDCLSKAEVNQLCATKRKSVITRYGGSGVRVRIILTIVVDEIVGKEGPQMRISVHTNATLVVIQGVSES